MVMTEGELELESLGGVGPATKQKLLEAGIYTILDLAVRGPMDVADAAGVDLSRAVDLCNKARAKLQQIGRLEKEFVSASELYKKRQAIERITTGSKNLDNLLDGG